MHKRCFCSSILFIFCFLSGCSDQKFNNLCLETNAQNSICLNKGNPGYFLLFLSPDCPMCISYAYEFNEMASKLEKHGIQSFGVLPGQLYAEEELNRYVDSTDFNSLILYDKNYELTKALGATVTPHFFLIDSMLRVVYHGPFDDKIIRLGKKKIHPTHQYVVDAVEAYLQNKKPDVSSVEPVGCMIELEE